MLPVVVDGAAEEALVVHFGTNTAGEAAFRLQALSLRAEKRRYGARNAGRTSFRPTTGTVAFKPGRDCFRVWCRHGREEGGKKSGANATSAVKRCAR